MQADRIIPSIDPRRIGERLALARKARGLTQQQVSTELGIARTTLTAIEGGTRSPRPEELVRLARLYDRSLGDLLQAAQSSGQFAFEVLLRSTALPADVQRSPELAADIQQFEQFCRWYVELEKMFNDPLPRRYPQLLEFRGENIAQSADDVASSERVRLGLGDGPIGDLYGLLEAEVGLRIFAFGLQSAGISGMFLYQEEWGGCIALNARHPETRRRWSLAHEYAHFLTARGRAEISLISGNKRLSREEKFADLFAKSFLMPASGLGRRFEAVRRGKTHATPADVLVLAHLYRVSFEAMMVRLEEIERLPKGAWSALKEKGFRVDKARQFVPLSTVSPDPMLPRRYELLTSRAYQRSDVGGLSSGQLARRLNLDRVSAQMRVEELTSETQLNDGEWSQMNLDLNAPFFASAD